MSGVEEGQQTEEVLYRGPLEDALKRQFTPLVDDLELAHVVQLPPGASKLPSGLDRYRLIPVTTMDIIFHSSDYGGFSVELPEDVEPHYGGRGLTPYIDTSLSIGLAYEGILSAIASGCTSSEGNIRVAQLQGVYLASGRNIGYKNGLYGGFLWRHSLVQAWAQIAEHLDAPALEIQSSQNLNRIWRGKVPTKQLQHKYDQVAQEMGFIRTPAGNWIRYIGQTMTSNVDL